MQSCEAKAPISELRFLRTPPLRPPPGVIPAQAGILTRGVIYKGSTIVDNCAGKSFFVFICLEVFGVDQGDV
jgi:hypothetical protein